MNLDVTVFWSLNLDIVFFVKKIVGKLECYDQVGIIWIKQLILLIPLKLSASYTRETENAICFNIISKAFWAVGFM